MATGPHDDDEPFVPSSSSSTILRTPPPLSLSLSPSPRSPAHRTVAAERRVAVASYGGGRRANPPSCCWSMTGGPHLAVGGTGRDGAVVAHTSAAGFFFRCLYEPGRRRAGRACLTGGRYEYDYTGSYTSRDTTPVDLTSPKYTWSTCKI